MQPFLVRCFTTALSLGVVSWVLPGVTITSVPALLVGAVVLALVNTIVKPVLVLLTLPLTFMTVGVFYFIVNGAAFSIAAWLVPGFIVSSFWWAILGCRISGVCFDVSRWFPSPPKVKAGRCRHHRCPPLLNRNVVLSGTSVEQ